MFFPKYYYGSDNLKGNTPGCVKDNKELIKALKDINLIYSAAIREVRTKIEILGDDFTTKHSYQPIHHIQSRLKSFDSIMEKAERYGIEDPINNLELVKERIYDIAGIRIICNYPEDMYSISNLLLSQSDISIIKVKDYCRHPKESGYRSLHIVITIPVFLVEGKLSVPVEIQFRSIAMDTWASLEHELKYKNKGILSDEIQQKLKKCAKTLADVDAEMEEIRQKVLN